MNASLKRLEEANKKMQSLCVCVVCGLEGTFVRVSLWPVLWKMHALSTFNSFNSSHMCEVSERVTLLTRLIEYTSFYFTSFTSSRISVTSKWPSSSPLMHSQLLNCAASNICIVRERAEGHCTWEKHKCHASLQTTDENVCISLSVSLSIVHLRSKSIQVAF